MLIGIVGGGQLAMMLAEAGARLGFRFSFLIDDNESDDCVRAYGRVVRHGPEDEPVMLYHRLGQPDIITVEKEAVDVGLLREFRRLCPVHPDPDAIEICQHRGRERRQLTALGVPTAEYRHVDSLARLRSAAAELGFPLILKACVQGYDGRNQWRLETSADIERLFGDGQPVPEAVLEKKVPFEREVSILAVRNRRGETRCYPATENFHADGVLLASIAPAQDLGNEQRRQIDEIVDRILGAWDYCGVLAIECFLLDDSVLVNELAPRVHNSGHWTQTGADICQFESHLRAISWMQLPPIRYRRHVAMINLLGIAAPSSLRGRGLDLRVYPKQIRPGRKMGHVNLLGSSREQLLARTEDCLQAIYGARRIAFTQTTASNERRSRRLRRPGTGLWNRRAGFLPPA